jgi:hypothetical protein
VGVERFFRRRFNGAATADGRLKNKDSPIERVNSPPYRVVMPLGGRIEVIAPPGANV